MMPRCDYGNCEETGTEYFGKAWDGEVHGDNIKNLEPICLCPKHAKKLRKMLNVNFEEDK